VENPNAIPRTALGGRRRVASWQKDFLRQAYCPDKGSFRNLLVYLPHTHRVKKGGGMVTGGGKVIHPSQPTKNDSLGFFATRVGSLTCFKHAT
jgi:hypothetical protein